MKHKLAVRRATVGRDFIGDCVGCIYPFETYLGAMVEPVGGVFSIIEFECADDEDLSDIEQLFTPYIVGNDEHPIYNNKFHLQPIDESDPYFYELLTTGRVFIDISILRTYIRERTDG